ncbi:MAG: DUF4282 domain-containing protein [Cyanobacteria bacterium CRU_2_1]|nr:DUF4282 domain-containing protein [Cyanobacteria bacterium RU_5_0]NJR60391.1 DUF4282 domain-containing protein [Cyanobacteria bacterium CRU_2_1]
MARQRGFFEKLFDFSFSDFIAVQIAGVIYAVIVILLALGLLAALIGGFAQGAGQGIAVLIFGPIIGFLYIVFARIGLEAFIAAIRTAENTRIIAENFRRPPGPPGF